MFNQRYSKSSLKTKALADTANGFSTPSPEEANAVFLQEIIHEQAPLPGKINQSSSYSSTLEALLAGYHPQDFATQAKHWAQELFKPGWQFYPEVIKSISEIDLSHVSEDAVKLWHLSEQALESSYATFSQGSSTDKAYLLGRWAHTGTNLAANFLLFKGLGAVAERAAVGSMTTGAGGLLENNLLTKQRVLTNILESRTARESSNFLVLTAKENQVLANNRYGFFERKSILDVNIEWTIPQLNPLDIQITHEITMSKNAFRRLINDIRQNGIKEPIKYVEHGGNAYVVDGNHRISAARHLGINEIPVTKVELRIPRKTIRDSTRKRSSGAQRRAC